MKLFRITLLLFGIALFSASCINERDWEWCETQGRFALFFEYHHTGNPDPIGTFLQHVDFVDVFVYDEAGNLAYHRPSISQAQMVVTRAGVRSTRPGIDLPIGSGANQLRPGGTYRVVAWGNVDRGAGRNNFESTNQVNEARIATSYDTPLHFGPGAARGAGATDFMITIPDTDVDAERTIQFTRAHTDIQIFIVNASDTPTVGLDNVAAGIAFNKVNVAGTTEFSRVADRIRPTPEVLSRNAEFTNFYVPLFPATTPKTLEISNSNGLNANLSLSDIIAGIIPPNVNQNVVTDVTSLVPTNLPVERIQIVLEIEQDPDGDDILVGIWVPGWVRVGVDPF